MGAIDLRERSMMLETPLLIAIDIQREYITPGRPYCLNGVDESLENCRDILAHARLERVMDAAHRLRVARADTAAPGIHEVDEDNLPGDQVRVEPVGPVVVPGQHRVREPVGHQAVVPVLDIGINRVGPRISPLGGGAGGGFRRPRRAGQE